MKLKKPARRNENIYDLDYHPCQEEPDQRVNQIVQARLLYYYWIELQYYYCTTVEKPYLGKVPLEIPALQDNPESYGFSSQSPEKIFRTPTKLQKLCPELLSEPVTP